jgi:GAF domain-containing protein
MFSDVVKTAARPENESDRLAALHEYRILGTKPEQSYDDITTIASETCRTPIALLSLVDADRQWFKSRVGVDVEETPRDWSFCAHAILNPEPLIVPDAHTDQRFKDNPLVSGEPGIRLYAGFPLQNDAAHRIGTLCVIDRRPGELSPAQCKVMEALARSGCWSPFARWKTKAE